MEYISRCQNPEYVSSVVKIKERLDELSPDEVEKLVMARKEIILHKWEACRNSAKSLFRQMNTTEGFEIKVYSVQENDTSVDAYLRVANFRSWTDKDGTYNFHYIFRQSDGSADYSSPSWGLGLKFTYLFGQHHNRTAELAIIDDNCRDILLSRVDGRPVQALDRMNTAIFMAATEEVINARIQSSMEALNLVSKALNS